MTRALVLLVFLRGLAACGDPTPNECGGEGELRDGDTPVAVGETCGACGDGVYVCSAEGGAECLGASPATSACGGCGVDPGELGESCGCGGTYTCDGSAMICSGAGAANECGGCDGLSEMPGNACDREDGEGVYRCTGLDEVTCLSLDSNGCGGSMALDATPATPCGTCERGVWVCDGPDAVLCHDGDRGINACGGCDPLEGEPEASCGICGGGWVCSEDGESVSCETAPTNACGGCASLGGSPGETCGDGGVRYCASPEALACGPAGGNACGGTTNLDGEVGAVCGDCGDGVSVCAGPDRLVCRGASALNACGGCGFLPGAVGESCAPLGDWTCVGTSLVCSYRDDANACGGSSTLDGELGAPCGACDLGRLACDGFEALRCEGGEDERALSWPDADGDGFGDAAATPTMDCTLDGRVRNDDDCDDTDASRAPSAAELCDGIDADCDGRVDEDATDGADFFVDADGDGYGNPARPVRGCAGAEGLAATGDDCDDTDPAFHPGAVEDDCTDDRDLNCDGSVAFVDMDGDGYAACVDCDDDPLRNPGVTERCDSVDNDCDGVTDETPLAGAPRWYPDLDGDGFGDDEGLVFACAMPSGHVPVGGDCDDADATAYSGADEICDGVDDDCDGVLDEGALDAIASYVDADGDGFGDDATRLDACTVDAARVLVGGDCDDRNDEVHPHTASSPRAEVCDFIDNDCDGVVDGPSRVTPTPWYADGDGDGYGDPADAIDACEPGLAAAAPAGRAPQDGDCDDSNPFRYTGAPEITGDEVDQDCDGRELCYVDGDGDGYGASDLSTVLSADAVCRATDGEAAEAALGDCDDTNAAVSPSATEIVGDNVDGNCDGQELCYRDGDSDGFLEANPGIRISSDSVCSRFRGEGDASTPRTDCDDTLGTVYPNAPDSVGTDLDENCDGYIFDLATIRTVSTSGSDVPSCGPVGNPCLTLGYALSLAGTRELAVESGAYIDTLELDGDFTFVGGFGPGFTGTPSGLSQLYPSSPVSANWTVSIDTTRFDSVAFEHFEIHGREGPNVATHIHPMAPESAVFYIPVEHWSTSFTTLVIRDSLIAVGRGARGTSTKPNGGAAFGVLNRSRNATIVVKRTTFLTGGGGDGVLEGEGGPSVGIGSASASLDIDTETVFERLTGNGGNPGPSQSAPCVWSSPLIAGLRCDPERVGLPAPVREVFIGILDRADQFSFTSDGGRRSVYARFDDVGESIDDMERTCADWHGARLVRLRSAEEENELARWLVGYDSDGDRLARTGFLDPEHDGVFQYDSFSPPPSYTNWAAGEPMSGGNERCVRSDGTFYESYLCHGERTGVAICETVAVGCPNGNECGPPGSGLVCRTDADLVPGCFPDDSVTAGREFPIPDANRLVRGGSTYEVLFGGDADTAAAQCAAWGGHLVDVDDDAEHDLVELLLVRTRDSFTVNPSNGFAWTSGTNRTPDDVFLQSDGSPMSYAPWRVGPSDDGTGWGMLLGYDGTRATLPEDATLSSSRWVAGPPYDLDLPFVCEHELN